jgi:hypothetical protein
VVLPAWLAVTVQAPAETSVKVLPLVVHTAGVPETNETSKLELAVACSAAGAVPSRKLAGAVKVMFCAKGAAATAKLTDTVAAAAYTLLPDWLAATLQVPADSSVRLLPLVVHTAGVVLVSSTSKPELADALKAGAGVPRRWSPGEAKLMVCAKGAANTLKVTATDWAAA